MFFIGIFGVESKEKEIKVLNNLSGKSCKSCNNDIDHNFKFCPYCGEKL